MSERVFKYYPKDFGKLCVKVHHMDLIFDVFDEKSEVTSVLHLEALEEIESISLNAKNLEILEVSSDTGEISHVYQKEKDMLLIKFSKKISKNTTFSVTTKTICKPTKHILEGLYYDETPDGAPPTQITQCQQWGFQRLVPCIDDMTAKCTYTTTIIADERYTNYLTNGDISIPVTPHSKGRIKVVYENKKVPMATYLFFLGVGTYATYTREFEYLDGSTFTLELLVAPDADKKAAEHALSILFDSVMWVHLYTGPGRYDNKEIRDQIWALVQEREELKCAQKEYKAIATQLETLSENLTLGYKYTGAVYREIAMQNSDFGGMENVGNTTITANRIMPYEHMGDGSFEYMIRVKAHEYYHNLNGSEVTGQSPFEIWLNEAVTVHIEREFHAFLFGEDYARLQEALYILSPARGVLSQDKGAASMPIEPDGFNDPNELITGITYVKAPEFVRMIETFMGKDVFAKGLDLYHTRYRYANATRAQWIEAMQEASGQSFHAMARTWLKQTKFPTLKITAKTQNNELVLSLTQTLEKDQQAWEFPFTYALFDTAGKKRHEATYRVSKQEESIRVPLDYELGFISTQRSLSFYGHCDYKQSEKELVLQARYDDDIVARYMAFAKLADRELVSLLEEESSSVSETFIELYGELLSQKEVLLEVGAQFLSIFSSTFDERFTHCYGAVYQARKKLMSALAMRYEKELTALYKELSQVSIEASYLEKQIALIKHRSLKNLCLGLLSYLDSEEVHALIHKQFESASCATDKIVALSLYLDSSAQDRFSLARSYMNEAAAHLVSWENFLYVVGRADTHGDFSLFEEVEASKHFRLEQANDQRGLYLSFAANKRISLETQAGRKLLENIILKVAKVNEYTTVHLLKQLGHVDAMQTKFHKPLIALLVRVLKELDRQETPSVYNTAKRMLANLPLALNAYENVHGKVNLND